MADLNYMDGKRDLRLDFLRGYSIFVMTLTHLGLASPLIFITGGSRFLINAAEVFFFISGFTVGYIAIGRTLGSQVENRLTRSWLIYRYILFFSFGLTLVLGQERLQEESQGEFVRWLVSLIALKEAAWDMDILIAYVIYIALAPLALWGLVRNRTQLVVMAIGGVYLLTQLAPFVMSLEFASFRHLAANTPLFFGAIVMGYHSPTLAAWWKERRRRRWADGTILVIGIALLVAFLTDYGGNEDLQDFLGHFVVREFLMPPHNLVIVTLYLRILWLMVTHLWGFLFRVSGWLFMPLGQDSMFAYCLQVTFIKLFYWWDMPVDWESHTLLRLSAEVIVVGLILGSVRLRRWFLTTLHRRNYLEWPHRHLINLLVWGTLIMLLGLALMRAEPGGWWWEDGDFFDDF